MLTVLYVAQPHLLDRLFWLRSCGNQGYHWRWFFAQNTHTKHTHYITHFCVHTCILNVVAGSSWYYCNWLLVQSLLQKSHSISHFLTPSFSHSLSLIAIAIDPASFVPATCSCSSWWWIVLVDRDMPKNQRQWYPWLPQLRSQNSRSSRCGCAT